MLDKINEMIEKYLAKPSEKITNNRYIKAIHEGFFAILPIIIIGSFFVVISSILQFCAR